jgi:cellulose biosynthesis protein BcsQ
MPTTPPDDALRPVLDRVIALTNGKGGVGKTSTTAALAVQLAEAGLHVLAVDLDPQGDLADDLGYIARSDLGENLMSAVLTGRPLTPLTGVRPGLDVVPGGAHLEDLADALAAMNRRRDTRLAFARSLAATLAATHYDFVLVDTPGKGPVLQMQALGAARWVLIPFRSDTSSMKNLAEVARRFEEVADVNPTIAVLGVFLHGVTAGATAVRRDVYARIRELLGNGVPILSSWVRYAEAAAVDVRARGQVPGELERLPAAGPWYARLRDPALPTGPAASSATLAGDYQHLAEEIFTRLSAEETTS